jgi:uncharacterized protein
MPFELVPREPSSIMSMARDQMEEEIERLKAYARNRRTPTESRALPADVERRFLSRHLDIRASDENGKRTLRGHAARFDKLSQDLGGFYERLAAGCFARSLRENADVMFLRGHNPDAIVARCSNGTLAVSEDSEGLAFECQMADTTVARDLYTDVKEGNITGMSFGMVVKKDRWDDTADDCLPGDPDDDCQDADRARRRAPLRTVLECSLLEISAVTMPAYLSSDVAARARALFPLGAPQSLPLEIRSLIGAASTFLSEEEKTLRVKMRIEALRAQLY